MKRMSKSKASGDVIQSTYSKRNELNLNDKGLQMNLSRNNKKKINQAKNCQQMESKKLMVNVQPLSIAEMMTRSISEVELDLQVNYSSWLNFLKG